MTETVKKTKAPAKPRKTKKETVAEMTNGVTPFAEATNGVTAVTPSREEIAQLARKYWAERGWQDGYAEHDWLRAEQELRGMAS